ncbi:DUF934 domain-containing protein [Pseudomonas sp. OIL-1]|uniref:DUF934 domain-containing protein n=1 Tax=Pseudomonas sp. OIL-1 TaxID=2706126 RepID=UPI0013A750D2|nr:DUF934 domain-containing protein [Pseudomonas sp. OIL-1]QIB50713.1 DUF934 domain-containing protein [Pseudomonas sp. OIL-1]
MNNLIRLTGSQGEIVNDDPWQLVREAGDLPAGPCIVPKATWLSSQSEAVLSGASASEHGMLLQPDDEPEDIADWLAVLPIIAVDFPSFRDGRGYSQAYLLRTRLGWTGELRAVGDVLRDQLALMRQCGFDTFAIREDKSVHDAIKGLAGMSVLYGRSAVEPRPLFRRRE